MKKYLFNFSESKKLYENNKNIIEPKMCYNNIFAIVTKHIEKFTLREYRVAYGYVSSFGNLLARHCFIVDKNETVIDPNVFTTSNIKNREYYITKCFEMINSYIDAIESEKRMSGIRTLFNK